jgi:hypothetical protein
MITRAGVGKVLDTEVMSDALPCPRCIAPVRHGMLRWLRERRGARERRQKQSVLAGLARKEGRQGSAS